MSTISTTDTAAVTSLMQEVAKIGTEAREASARFKARGEMLATSKKEHDRDGKGFSTPLFVGLRRVAVLYHDKVVGNGRLWDARHQDILKIMVTQFTTAYTERTEKSDAGGTGASFAAIIGGGRKTARLLDIMQERRDYWQSVADSAGNDESGRATRQTAERFITVCGQAPQSEGGPVIFTTDKGKVVKAKHYGRPSKVVNGVSIKWGGATNPLAIAGYAARLLRDYGDAVLNPNVVDAILDNGGKVDVEMTAQDYASAAAKAIADLMQAGGADSDDAATLQVLSAVLTRIARDGLKKSEGAWVSDADADADADAGPDSDESAESEVGTGGGSGAGDSLDGLIDGLLDEAAESDSSEAVESATPRVKTKAKAKKTARKKGGALTFTLG